MLGLDPVRDHAALVPHIGVMLQKGGVYPMLGPAQVLHLFARYYDHAEDPEAMLDLVGLRAVRRTPWRRLSGGEQQRLALALALVGKPQVLFLDEPTAGVDPEGRIMVRDVIADQRDRGICVILTTHELAEAERLADHVVIIDRGRILAEGSPAELASGTADGSIRFSTRPALDTAALAAALDRERPSTRAGPTAVAPRSPRSVPGPTDWFPRPAPPAPPWWPCWPDWLAERDMALGDLRTGHSLEEAYLSITGARGEAQASEPDGPAAGSGSEVGSRSSRRRSRRGSARSGRGAER